MSSIKDSMELAISAFRAPVRHVRKYQMNLAEWKSWDRQDWKRYVIGELIGAIPMLSFIGVFCLAFYFVETIDHSSYFVFHSPLDDLIPFREEFVLAYFSWFVYMVLFVLCEYLFDKEAFHRESIYLYFGMTLLIIVSLIFPNMQDLRPAVMPRNNWFTSKILWLYSLDPPINVAPSIHVYDTVSVMITARSCRHFIFKFKPVHWLINFMGTMIVLSTLFIKQHSIYDLLLGFVCLLIPAFFMRRDKT